MNELELGRTLLLFLWSFGLAGIEIEIEGGVGWAERLPTWYFKRGRLGRVYGIAMGRRPLTGYLVYAFTIPLLVLHLPYAMGVDWSLAGELRTVATYFVLAVVWDYLWFVLNRHTPPTASGAATSGGLRSPGSGAFRSTTTSASRCRSGSRDSPRSPTVTRRSGADDRAIIRTYPPPAPEAVWSGGVPDLDPLERRSEPDNSRVSG